MKPYFGAQVSKTRLNVEVVEEECVCIQEHTKTKTVSEGKKERVAISLFGLSHG